MEEIRELLKYIFGAVLSLSIFLVIIKLFGVPITWVAAMLPLLTYVAIMSILSLIGSIAGIVMSIQENMRG
jgi:hypothetical protein|uniref:Uncharacterized protein n=1 Tax=Siphoviridae sp. ctGiO6 TaxID=2825415 RepID=A0A8S5P809_9CAUD|nr:MAG TPA: hypothetical protein [Siphoviridae sp. ctGiO6]DAJ16368.1 MAG TPA: hypothetical protein [Siphoviridae sp. ct9Ec1]DAW44005.1 MAG TPA: hypothetical protein [Caudoviricetes sp.]